MKNEGLKTLFSIPCVILFGCLDIIGTVFEMIYQLVRLIRRGFKLFVNMFLGSLTSLVGLENDVDYGIVKAIDKNEVQSDDYEIFDID